MHTLADPQLKMLNVKLTVSTAGIALVIIETNQVRGLLAVSSTIMKLVFVPQGMMYATVQPALFLKHKLLLLNASRHLVTTYSITL